MPERSQFWACLGVSVALHLLGALVLSVVHLWLPRSVLVEVSTEDGVVYIEVPLEDVEIVEVESPREVAKVVEEARERVAREAPGEPVEVAMAPPKAPEPTIEVNLPKVAPTLEEMKPAREREEPVVEKAMPELGRPMEPEKVETAEGTLLPTTEVAMAPQPTPIERERPDMKVPGPKAPGPVVERRGRTAAGEAGPTASRLESASGPKRKRAPTLGSALGTDMVSALPGNVVTKGADLPDAARGPQSVGSARPASVAVGPLNAPTTQPSGPLARRGVAVGDMDAPGAPKGEGLPSGARTKAAPALGRGIADESESRPSLVAGRPSGVAGKEPGGPIKVAMSRYGDQPLVVGVGGGVGILTGKGEGGGSRLVLLRSVGGGGGPGGRGGSGARVGSGAGKGAPRLGGDVGGDEGLRGAPGSGGKGEGGLGGGYGGGKGGPGMGGKGSGGPVDVVPGRAGGGRGLGPEAYGIPGADVQRSGMPGVAGLKRGVGAAAGIGGPGIGGPSRIGRGIGGGGGKGIADRIGTGVKDEPVSVPTRGGGGGGTGGTGETRGGPGARGPLRVGAGVPRGTGTGLGAGLPTGRAGGKPSLGGGVGAGEGPGGRRVAVPSAGKARPRGLYVDVEGTFDMPLGITTSDYNADASGMTNLLEQVRRRTKVHVTVRERFLPLELENIKDTPIIHIRGHKAFAFSEHEREVLRKYVQQGGTIFGESSHGPFGPCFQREMKKVFGRPLQNIPLGHELYRAFYVLESVPRGDMGEQHLLMGLPFGNRLGVIYSRNDYGDLWEGTGGWIRQEDREPALKMGINIYVYVTAHWNR